MKKIFNALKTAVLLAVLLLAFTACDKDYATIGSNIIGENNYQTTNFSYPVITYNKKLDAIQTNNLPSNFIGYYDDPVYGTTTASLVTQLSVSSTSLSSIFGMNVKMDSVALTIPYYSHVDTEADTGYKLDSIYGNNPDAQISVSVYRNNYFLSDLDSETNFEDSQKYYSNGATSSGGMVPQPSETDLLFTELDIMEGYTVPSSKQIYLTENEYDDPEEDEVVTETQSPGLRLVKYDTESLQFWKELIIDKENEEEISNNSNFYNYFRGLYIKGEPISGDGQMLMLNTTSSNAKITIYFTSIADTDKDEDGIPDDIDHQIGETTTGEDTNNNGVIDEYDLSFTGGEDVDGDGFDDEFATYVNKTIVLDFSGNTFNIFDNEFKPEVLQAIENPNTTTGDEKLFLKGGSGSLAIIEMFNGLVEDENGVEVEAFNHFQSFFKDENGNTKRLINEAYLVFYEDENTITEDLSDEHQYDRLFLYNLEKNAPVLDYYYDTEIATSPYVSIINHLGQRYEDESGANKYKIRITEYIKSLLEDEDPTNAKLGLVSSTNVNSYANLDVLESTEEDDVTNLPSGAVLSARGTVLYGNATSNTDKKVKLEIYYTEPNN